MFSATVFYLWFMIVSNTMIECLNDRCHGPVVELVHKGE
jgi:hypothetical protein